jgi:flagellar basal body-associated protein FliL
MEMLKDQRKQNKRLFIIILVILGMWLLTIGAFMYYILTVDYEEDYREQLVENITENEELKIINGDSYGNSKAN